MEEEAKAFIKSELEAGRRFDEVRRQMISQGYGTAGFEDAYHAIAHELGIKDVRPQPATMDQPYVPPPLASEKGFMPLPSIPSMLKYGFHTAYTHMSSIVAATLLAFVSGILMLIAPALPGLYLSGPMHVVAMIFVVTSAAVFGFVSASALMYVIAHGDDHMTFVDGFVWSFKRFFSVLWLSMITSAISLVSFAALIIPGVLFFFYNIFSFIALARDDHRGVIAIVRSTDLVRGYFWGILGRFIVLAIFYSIVALPILGTAFLISTIELEFSGGQLIGVLVLAFLQALFLAASFGSIVSLYNARVHEKSLFDIREYGLIKWVYRIVGFVGLLIPVAGFIAAGITVNSFLQTMNFDVNSSYDQFQIQEEFEKETLEDYRVRFRVDAAFTTGNIYYSKIRTYEGVCKDVTIEDPVRCQSTVETFVLDAPLSTGKVYCRDSNGFKGVLDGPAPTPRGCELE